MLSKRTKIIIGVVVAIIILIAVWFFFYSVSPQKALFLSTLELLVNPSIEGFEMSSESDVNVLGTDEKFVKIMNAASQASKELLSPEEIKTLCYPNPDSFAKKFANIAVQCGIAAKKLDNISSLTDNQIYSYATIGIFTVATSLKISNNPIEVLNIKKNILGQIKSIIISKEFTYILFFTMFAEGQVTSPFVKAAIARLKTRTEDASEKNTIVVDEPTLIDILITIIGTIATSPEMGKCITFSTDAPASQ